MRLIFGLFLSLIVTPGPAAAWLADDLRTDTPLRHRQGGVIVSVQEGGEAVSGWLSNRSLPPTAARYVGSRDYLLYAPLQSGLDLPIDTGALEVRFRYQRDCATAETNEALLALLDERGEVIFFLAVGYRTEEGQSRLIVSGADGIREKFELAPLPQGVWLTLRFEWDDRSGRNSLSIVEGERRRSYALGSWTMAPLIRRTLALRLGLGDSNFDPSCRTLISDFRFLPTSSLSSPVASP